MIKKTVNVKQVDDWTQKVQNQFEQATLVTHFCPHSLINKLC